MLSGLFAAIVLYPVLHEFGHAAFAFLLGMEIEEINLFSEFSVICRVDNSDTLGAALTGYGGIIAPIIFSCIFSSRFFVLRYMNFSVKIINLIVLINAVVALVLFIAEKPVLNNDITTVLTVADNSFIMTCVVIFICLIFVAISLKNKNILNDFYSFVTSDKIVTNRENGI